MISDLVYACGDGDGRPALKWGSTNAYSEDAQGRPIYDWTIVDHIFDTYRPIEHEY